jgi:hypothetical protein
MITALLLLSAGLGAGIAAGLGVGGGAILIPCLTIFLGMDQRVAQGINLLYFIPTAVIAVITHVKNKKINKDVVKGLIFYGLTGAVAGAFLAMSLKQEWLRAMFGYFLLVIGMYELLGKADNKKDAKRIGVN